MAGRVDVELRMYFASAVLDSMRGRWSLSSWIRPLHADAML